MSKPVTFSIRRDALAAAMGKITRSITAKANDPEIRKQTYFELDPATGKMSIFATDEIVFFIFRGIECDTDGEINPFTMETDKIAKFADAATGDIIKFALNESEAKILLQSGSRKAALGYTSGQDFHDRMQTDEVIKYPNDLDEFTPVDKISVLRTTFALIAKCADSKKAHLNGVYTDGEGLFMATDQYTAARIDTAHKWGFAAMIPLNFMTLTESIPEETIYVKWENGILWARNKDATVVVSTFTLNPEGFPSKQINKYLDSLANDAVYIVTVSSGDLTDEVSTIQTFLGKDTICDLEFKKKLVITGKDQKTKDIMRASVVYHQEENSEDIKEFTFRSPPSALLLIAGIFDKDFTLYIEDAKTPIYAVNQSIGVRIMITPYHVNTAA